MLWTDGIFITIEDLQRVDGGVLQVATDEGIPITGNYSFIRGAIEEATQELQKMSVAFGGYLSTGDVSPNHTAAVLNIGLGNAVRYKALPSQVVVSGPAPFTSNHVKLWATSFALMYLYRNASNRTVKDRYESKMRYYKSEIDKRLARSVMGLGLPLTIQPLAAPAATFERNSGSWTSANVTSAVQAGPTGGTFDVAVTYVNQGVLTNSGYTPDSTKYVSYLNPGNAESNPSTVQTVVVASGHVVHVDITSLNPSIGSQDPSQRILCVMVPLAATGWNIYVGTSGGTLYLQNLTPIPINTKTYQLAANPVNNTLAMGIGQYADRILSMSPTRQRG